MSCGSPTNGHDVWSKLKGRKSETNRLEERERSHYSRICNHHSRCGWLCRNSVSYSQKRRSQKHASRSGSFCLERDRELGSVTAEFAIILPAVILILITGIQVLGIQSSRVKVIGLAAESARAIARGEDQLLVDSLIAERAFGSKVEIQHLDLSVCVVISTSSKIGMLDLPISEKACARKSGL